MLNIRLFSNGTFVPKRITRLSLFIYDDGKRPLDLLGDDILLSLFFLLLLHLLLPNLIVNEMFAFIIARKR